MSGRMLLLVLAGITMSGCNGLRDMLSARPEVAAEAKGQELKVERLAVLMTALKGVPLTREAAEFIASTWVDYTLFSQAVAAGRDLADSTIAAQVLWPELAEARGVRWHDSLLAHRAPLDPTLADSVYHADDVRVFQHILIRLPPNAEPPTRQAAHKRAEQVYGRIMAGGNFAKLAGQFSDDPGSKVDGGYLPPAPRGKWVTAFDSAGWTLSPGGMTNVIESPFGFHIIRRPPAAEVRDRLLAFTRQQVGMKIDSMYLDSLGIRKHLKVASDAPSTVRKALADRDNSLNSATAIATYDGGSLTVADLMRWMTAGGPTWSSDLAARPDSVLTRFAKLIGQNKLLLAEADSAGVRVSPDEWAGMVQRYRAQLDTLRLTLGIAEGEIADPATTAADRAKVVAIKLDGYWDRLVAGRSRPRAIPGQLSAMLRAEGGYRVNSAAMDRALDLARDLKAKADSAAKAPQPVPQQAPGAPPILPVPGGQ
jgi:hypothetical protein